MGAMGGGAAALLHLVQVRVVECLAEMPFGAGHKERGFALIGDFMEAADVTDLLR